MTRSLRRGLTPTRLRIYLALLFCAIVVPTVLLVLQAQRQIKWEAFAQHRALAEELAQRIDDQLQRLIAAEEARAYADYGFLVVAGDPATGYVQRSPLAEFPLPPSLPGMLGYFQVDADGQFSSPALPQDLSDPAALGLSDSELAARRQLSTQLLDVLSRNSLVARRRPEPAAEPPADVADLADLASGAGSSSYDEEERDVAAVAQEAFDRLNAPAPPAAAAKAQPAAPELAKRQAMAEEAVAARARSKSESELEQRRKSAKPRLSRKEQTALIVGGSNIGVLQDKDSSAPVRIFESEVDPFELALLDSGHFVLFRKVWRDGARTIQGVLLDQTAFLDGAIAQAFRHTALASMSDLAVLFRGELLREMAGTGATGPLQGTALHQLRLSAPLGDLQLAWTIRDLPAGPGARVVAWTSAVLLGVLLLAFASLERLGMRQIRLARQQQDFVSAVSHELKTPLTSIRMYGEMLREGWVGEDKKREYYAFIHDEAERLSRLIGNVLQLARMERNDLKLELKPVTVAALVDLMRSRIHTQVERAGFACEWRVDPACADQQLSVDVDAFTQIVINIVDNALKFCAKAERKLIEISVRPAPRGHIAFAVRDYGPGVPRAQMKKIFELFYRAGSELTRQTIGTGIGLALVRQLAQAMGGEVDVVNRDSGAEFELRLRSAAH